MRGADDERLMYSESKLGAEYDRSRKKKGQKHVCFFGEEFWMFCVSGGGIKACSADISPESIGDFDVRREGGHREFGVVIRKITMGHEA